MQIVETADGEVHVLQHAEPHGQDFVELIVSNLTREDYRLFLNTYDETTYDKDEGWKLSWISQSQSLYAFLYHFLIILLFVTLLLW